MSPRIREISPQARAFLQFIRDNRNVGNPLSQRQMDIFSDVMGYTPRDRNDIQVALLQDDMAMRSLPVYELGRHTDALHH